jgi:putative pyruvate formate lyase activating enzyme
MEYYLEELINCKLCPRNCGINRYEKVGYCKSGVEIRAARAFLHRWEEPCISGEKGSGAVFFTNCNLDCVFCQNYKISHGGHGREITVDRLPDIFIELQEKGAHNINLVTPTHYIPQIREAIIKAKKIGLNLPIVYNSNAYENVEALMSLEGLIDIYLPDLKYFGNKLSIKYSKAPGYFKNASGAVLEMFRQVGVPVFDANGIMKRGLMIRHLMLPGGLFDSKKILDWVLEKLPRSVYFNIMCQYTPLNRACEYPEINKKLNRKHYEALVDYAISNGLESGFIQEFESANEEYVPEFDFQGI